MAIETKHKEIDGMKVSVTQWPARKAFFHKRKLGYLFGPALGELAAGLDSKDIKEASKKKTKKSIADKNFDMSKLGSGIEKLFDRLTEEEIDNVFRFMFSGVRIADAEMTLEMVDVTFAGKMMSVYKVFGFVLEVNFGSFLGKGSIGKLLGKFQTE